MGQERKKESETWKMCREYNLTHQYLKLEETQYLLAQQEDPKNLTHLANMFPPQHQYMIVVTPANPIRISKPS